MKFPEMSHEFIKQRLMPKPGKVACVIDTDTFNEIDDQFAVAWALRSGERLDVKAVYAAPFYFDCFFKKAGEKVFPAQKAEVFYAWNYYGGHHSAHCAGCNYRNVCPRQQA